MITIVTEHRLAEFSAELLSDNTILGDAIRALSKNLPTNILVDHPSWCYQCGALLVKRLHLFLGAVSAPPDGIPHPNRVLTGQIRVLGACCQTCRDAALTRLAFEPYECFA